MKKFGIGALIFFSVFLTTNSFAASYKTSCKVKDGKAIGYATTAKYKSLTISGYVKFILYDEKWDQIDTERTYEYEYLYNTTEEIETVSVSAKVKHCLFDISEAVKEEKPPEEPKKEYSTHCLVQDGEAKAYAKSAKYKSLTISGYVEVTFYDEYWDELDTDRFYTYEYIYNDIELIDTRKAPKKTTHCTFDISEAVNN